MSCGCGFLTSCHHMIIIDEVESENRIIPCESGNSHGCCYVMYQQPSWNSANVQYGPSMCQVQETLHPSVTRQSSIICPSPPQCSSKSVTSCGCGIGVIPSKIVNISITGKTINLSSDHHSVTPASESETSIQQSPSRQETKEQHTEVRTSDTETVCTCRFAKSTQPAIQSKKAPKDETYTPHSSKEARPKQKQKQVTPRSTHFNQFECKRDCECPICKSAPSHPQKQRHSRLVTPVKKSAQKQRQYKDASHAPLKPSEYLDPEEPVQPQRSDPSHGEPTEASETESADEPRIGEKRVIRDSVKIMRSKHPKMYDHFSDITSDSSYSETDTPKRIHTSYHQKPKKKYVRKLKFGDTTPRADVEATAGCTPPPQRPDPQSARDKFVRFHSFIPERSPTPLDVASDIEPSDGEPPEQPPLDTGRSAVDPKAGQKQVIQDSDPTMTSKRLEMYDNFRDIANDGSYNVIDTPKRRDHKKATTKTVVSKLKLGDGTTMEEAPQVETATEQMPPAHGLDIHSAENQSVRSSSTRAEHASTARHIKHGPSVDNEKRMADSRDNADIPSQPLKSHDYDEQNRERVYSHLSHLEGSGYGEECKSYEIESPGTQADLNQGPKAPEKTPPPFHTPFPHSSPSPRQTTTGHKGASTPYLKHTENGSISKVDGQRTPHVARRTTTPINGKPRPTAEPSEVPLDLVLSVESSREKTAEQDILNQQATVNDLAASGFGDLPEESEVAVYVQSIHLEGSALSDVLQGSGTTPSAKEYTKSTSHVRRRLLSGNSVESSVKELISYSGKRNEDGFEEEKITTISKKEETKFTTPNDDSIKQPKVTHTITPATEGHRSPVVERSDESKANGHFKEGTLMDKGGKILPSPQETVEPRVAERLADNTRRSSRYYTDHSEPVIAMVEKAATPTSEDTRVSATSVDSNEREFDQEDEAILRISLPSQHRKSLINEKGLPAGLESKHSNTHAITTSIPGRISLEQPYHLQDEYTPASQSLSPPLDTGEETSQQPGQEPWSRKSSAKGIHHHSQTRPKSSSEPSTKFPSSSVAGSNKSSGQLTKDTPPATYGSYTHDGKIFPDRSQQEERSSPTRSRKSSQRSSITHDDILSNRKTSSERKTTERTELHSSLTGRQFGDQAPGIGKISADATVYQFEAQRDFSNRNFPTERSPTGSNKYSPRPEDTARAPYQSSSSDRRRLTDTVESKVPRTSPQFGKQSSTHSELSDTSYPSVAAIPSGRTSSNGRKISHSREAYEEFPSQEPASSHTSRQHRAHHSEAHRDSSTSELPTDERWSPRHKQEMPHIPNQLSSPDERQLTDTGESRGPRVTTPIGTQSSIHSESGQSSDPSVSKILSGTMSGKDRVRSYSWEVYEEFPSKEPRTSQTSRQPTVHSSEAHRVSMIPKPEIGERSSVVDDSKISPRRGKETPIARNDRYSHDDRTSRDRLVSKERTSYKGSRGSSRLSSRTPDDTLSNMKTSSGRKTSEQTPLHNSSTRKSSEYQQPGFHETSGEPTVHRSATGSSSSSEGLPIETRSTAGSKGNWPRHDEDMPRTQDKLSTPTSRRLSDGMESKRPISSTPFQIQSSVYSVSSDRSYPSASTISSGRTSWKGSTSSHSQEAHEELPGQARSTSRTLRQPTASYSKAHWDSSTPELPTDERWSPAASNRRASRNKEDTPHRPDQLSSPDGSQLSVTPEEKGSRTRTSFRTHSSLHAESSITSSDSTKSSGRTSRKDRIRSQSREVNVELPGKDRSTSQTSRQPTHYSEANRESMSPTRETGERRSVVGPHGTSQRPIKDTLPAANKSYTHDGSIVSDRWPAEEQTSPTRSRKSSRLSSGTPSDVADNTKTSSERNMSERRTHSSSTRKSLEYQPPGISETSKVAATHQFESQSDRSSEVLPKKVGRNSKSPRHKEDTPRKEHKLSPSDGRRLSYSMESKEARHPFGKQDRLNSMVSDSSYPSGSTTSAGRKSSKDSERSHSSEASEEMPDQDPGTRQKSRQPAAYHSEAHHDHSSSKSPTDNSKSPGNRTSPQHKEDTPHKEHKLSPSDGRRLSYSMESKEARHPFGKQDRLNSMVSDSSYPSGSTTSAGRTSSKDRKRSHSSEASEEMPDQDPGTSKTSRRPAAYHSEAHHDHSSSKSPTDKSKSPGNRKSPQHKEDTPHTPHQVPLSDGRRLSDSANKRGPRSRENSPHYDASDGSYFSASTDSFESTTSTYRERFHSAVEHKFVPNQVSQTGFHSPVPLFEQLPGQARPAGHLTPESHKHLAQRKEFDTPNAFAAFPGLVPRTIPITVVPDPFYSGSNRFLTGFNKVNQTFQQLN